MAMSTQAFIILLLAVVAVYITNRWPFQQNLVPFDTETLDDAYDYIVVGGGSAGSVVASRLSEDPQSSVLVLEAGGHYKEDPLFDIPIKWLDLEYGKADWAYFTVPQTHSSFGLTDKKSFWPRGKVLGGSSVLNAMQYTRGNRHEYDEWAANGCTGWSYKDVLPYFLKSEDMTIESLKSSKYHSTGGPLAVSGAKVTPLADRYISAGQELGYDVVDYNGEQQDGVSPIQLTVRKGTRSSTGLEFIGPNIGRRNLHIGLNSHATKIEVKDKRASGVYFIRNGRKLFIKANKEIVVSAGAVNTPQLLMLSGIGPKKHLQELNIPVVADLPVGESLQDHMMLFMMVDIKEPISIGEKDKINLWSKIQYRLFGKGVLAMNGGDGAGFFYLDDRNKGQRKADIQFIFFSMLLGSNFWNFTQEVADEFLNSNENAHGITGVISQMHPWSRGTIRLASTDPFDYPLIDPRYLTDRRDVDDFIQAIRIWEKFVETPTFKRMGADMSRMKLSFCSQHEFRSDDYWECILRHLAIAMYHPSCTCKMGAASDPTAVLDPQLRVKGIHGLRVVDASAMPNVTSGNTNAPVIMMAEKCADMIRGIDSVSRFRENLPV